MKRVTLVLLAFAAIAFGQAVRITALSTSSESEAEPSVSPDGKTVAFVRGFYGDGDLFTMPMGGGKAARLASFRQKTCWSGSPSWSPDGLRIAYVVSCSEVEGAALFVRDLASRTSREMAKISQDNQIISWSADSKFLAFTAPNGRAMVVAVEGAKPPRQLVTEGANATFSPDGKWLAYSQEGVLKVAELTRDLYVMGDALTLARAAGPISRIMWMPDSKRILYEVERGSGPCYRTVELARGAQPSQPIELPARLILTQVLPDGSVVGTELVGGVIQRLDLRTRAQTWLKWSYQSIRPSPDGTRVAYVNSACAGMSQILVADAGLGNSRVLVDGGAIADLQWTADGKSIVYQTLESKYVIVPAGGGGRPQPTTVDVKAWPIRRTLSADGKFYRRVNDRNETCQTPVSGGFEECAAEGKRYAAFGRNFLFSLDGYGEGTMVFQIDPVTRKAQGVAQLKWTPAYATVAGADDRYLYLEEGETEYGAGIVRVTGLFRR